MRAIACSRIGTPPTPLHARRSMSGRVGTVRRVANQIRPHCCKAVVMGQPHKGERVLLQTRPHREVWEAVHVAAHAAGMSVSQYLADVLAEHVGRPDLVRELGRNEEVLPLAM